jgi:hypothetical protein
VCLLLFAFGAINARKGRMTNFTRLLLAAAVIALALTSTGCSILPGPLKKLDAQGNSSDEALRKRVQADSFPAAKNVGL